MKKTTSWPLPPLVLDKFLQEDKYLRTVFLNIVLVTKVQCNECMEGNVFHYSESGGCENKVSDI